MNDLKDLQWQTPATNGNSRHAQQNSTTNYSPVYQRHNNPFSLNAAENKKSNAVSTSLAQKSNLSNVNTGDSFGGLVSFGTDRKPDASKLSLAEQAAAQQAKKLADLNKSSAAFSNAAFFDSQLGRPSSTVTQQTISSDGMDFFGEPNIKRSQTETSDDILAQINGNRPVDKSSFYPPPPSPTRASQTKPPQLSDRDTQRHASGRHNTVHDDDDILGILGQPIARPIIADSQVDNSRPPHSYATPQVHRPTASILSSSSQDSSRDGDHEDDDDDDIRRAKQESLRDQARRPKDESFEDPRAPIVLQIVEMGYTTRQAQAALAQTNTGMDLEAAVELLLTLNIEASGGRQVNQARDSSMKSSHRNQVKPSHERPGQVQNEAGDWVDSTYDLASKTLATANNWFSNKSALARRKLAEYNASTATQTHASRFDERPKWMRDAEKYERREKGKSKAKDEEDEVIREEGLPMHPQERKRLEMNGVLPAVTRRGSVESTRSAKSMTGSIRSIPDSFRAISSTITAQIPSQAPLGNTSVATTDHGSKVDSRRFKANDDEVATLTSSRRRRPATEREFPQVEAKLPSSASAQVSALSNTTQRIEQENEEEDLFGRPTTSKNKGKGKAVARSSADVYDQMGGNSGLGTSLSILEPNDIEEVDLFSAPKPKAETKVTSKPPSAKSEPARQRARIARKVPYVDTTALARSSQQRSRGSEAFRRGDFANALTSYGTSLNDIPDLHPVRILSLTNRAITHIHLGSPKSAVRDCDEALQIIGPNRGADEFVEDAGKTTELLTIWGKAMTRKATALEMQERFIDALVVWQDLVKSGAGGSQAIQSRQRCENMSLPKAKPSVAKAVSKPAPPSQASRAAVQKLRDEDTRMAKDEAQKDSLYSTVDSRISTWSAGKEQNLRALLSSLDQVLWPASGWKKVTLADLVVNAKVKIIYMKALAKVHPDKIPRDANVEEKMIAAGVFAKLNGAWDTFKKQNNM